MVKAFGQIVKAIWKPFEVYFQDLSTEIRRQEGIIEHAIRLASEVEAHRERLQASMYRSAAAEQHLDVRRYQDEGRQNYSAQMIRLANIQGLSVQQYVDMKSEAIVWRYTLTSTFTDLPIIP
jgi:hypothetical protein